MAQKYANAARAELAATINDTDLALEIVTGGELFPVADTGSSAISAAADWFKLTLQDDAGYEIVFVRTHTSGSVNFTNILRGQEGTTAREFLAGSVVGLRPTAGDAESYATSDDLTATATTKLPLTGGTMTGAITFAGAQTWPTLNQNTTGNAATATKLATARTINGVSFDGTANISVQVDWTGGISGKPAVIAAGADAAAARAAIGAGSGDVTLAGAQTLTNKTLTTPLITGTREVRVAMPANAIDLATGNLFTKTISGATTLTVSNVPTTGTAASFILELTNAGSAAITWFSGVKWAGGTAPTLTASGVDVLGFYSHNGGTTWRGLVLAKDSK